MKLEDKNIMDLPPEILLLCFSFLNSPKDLISLSKTNHRVRKIAMDQQLWRNYSHFLPKPDVQYVWCNRSPIRFTAFADLGSDCFATGDDKTIFIFETKKFHRIKFVKLSSKLNVFATLPNNRLAIGCGNGIIEIWRLLINKTSNSNMLHFFNKRHRKVKIEIKDFYQEKVIHVHHCHKTTSSRTSGIFALASLANGKLASGGCCNSSVYIWDVNNGKCILELRGHHFKVTALAVLPNGRLVSGSDTEMECLKLTDRVRIWDLDSGKSIKILEKKRKLDLKGFYKDVEVIQPLPDNKLAVCRRNERIRIYDSVNGKLIRILNGRATKLALLHSGHLASWKFKATYIYVWDINTGNIIKKIRFDLKVNKKIGSNETEYGDIIVLNDGRLVCGKSGDDIHVFQFPSIPENKLLLLEGHNDKEANINSHKCKQM